MKLLARPRWPEPDLTATPWVLLFLLWFASFCQQTGILLVFVDDFGIGYFFSSEGSKYLDELKHALVPYSVLGFVAVLLLYPKWSWLLCGALLLGSVAIGVRYSELLNNRAFWVSSLVPVLVYLLATIVAVRRRRSLPNGV